MRGRSSGSFTWLLVAALGAVGCARGAGRPAPRGDGGVARGDRVVVEQTAATFFEGRVLSIESERLRVERADQGDQVVVAASDAYKLPPESRMPRDGELAICNVTGMHWVGCRIEHADGTTLVALDADGKKLGIGADRALRPTPVTALNLRRFFDRAARRAEFVLGAERSGSPRPPPGWKPLPHRRLIAHHGSGWFSATVHELTDDGLYVVFASEDRTEKLDYRDVVPEPPYSETFHPGEYVLLRPPAVAQGWKPVRVVVSSPNGIRVEDVNGAISEASPADLVPLQPPTP